MWKKTIYCNGSKKCGMLNIINKKSITCNSKLPCFKYTNEKQALYCNDCKKCGMIHIIKDVSHVI